ncbi:MAG TPA: DinB family protein [Gemmatimonadales bacterium]
MKVRRQLESIEPLVLEMTKSLRPEEWQRAPGSKWSIAQVVGHLAISTDIIATRFEERADRTDMARRATPKQQLLRHLALGVGKLPSPRKIPPEARPPENPDPELVTAQFRMAIQRLQAMIEQWPTERQERVFVAHPILGDLNLPEWVRFFYLHCRFAAHKIRVRTRWLRRAS